MAFAYAERYTGMRKLLMAAQRSLMAHGELVDPTAGVGDGSVTLGFIDNHAWDSLVLLAKDATFDHQQGLIDLFWAIPDDHTMATDWRAKVAKAVHETGYTPDKVVHFLGTCAQLMKEG
jgi:hypothetical protein